MSILQLNPPLPLETPRGSAYAHLVIDYGPEEHLMWVCFLDANGECWTFANHQVRIQKNITLGRDLQSQAKSTPESQLKAQWNVSFRVTLEQAKPGLFLFESQSPAYKSLGFKSEYRTENSHIEAFVLSSGEAFWGGAKTQEERAQLPVREL